MGTRAKKKGNIKKTCINKTQAETIWAPVEVTRIAKTKICSNPEKSTDMPAITPSPPFTTNAPSSLARKMIKPTRNSYHHSERTRQEAPPYKTTIRSLRPQPHPSRVSIQAPLPSFLSGEKWKQRWDEWGLGCHTTTKEKKNDKERPEKFDAIASS